VDVIACTDKESVQEGVIQPPSVKMALVEIYREVSALPASVEGPSEQQGAPQPQRVQTGRLQPVGDGP